MSALIPHAPALLERPPAELLDPGTLNEAAEKAIGAFFREGQSANTARTYRTALNYWGAWHALRYGVAIEGPVSPAAVLQFIVDHLEHNPNLPPPELSAFTPHEKITQHLLPPEIDATLVARNYKAKTGPWSMATVSTRLAALGKAHELYIADNRHLNLGPETNPLRDPRVRQLVAAAKRAYARRGRSRRVPSAATRSILEVLLETCGNDLHGIRDRALLLFGWASGGRRRSEITAASFDNVKIDGEGFVYELGVSKTNQSAIRQATDAKPIQGIAATALRAWLNVLIANGITEGKIFRRVLNEQIHEPLYPRAVRDIIQRRAQMSGQALGRLSAHSLRSGFVTEAGKQGLSLGETMALTGHRSVQTVMGYYQSGELSTSKGARLLESED